MMRYFIPVNSTRIEDNIPKNEKILCSLLSSGSYSTTVNKQTRYWNWMTHIIITKNGIAYKNHFNLEAFYYWNQVKSIRFGTRKIKIFGETLSIDRSIKKKEIFPIQTWEVLRQNFGPFVRMVHANYKGFLKEMKDFERNIESLKEKIHYFGFNVFINECYSYSWAGFTPKAIIVARNLYTILSTKQEQVHTLYFIADCYRRLEKYAEVAAECEKILSIDPDDLNAKKLRDKSLYEHARNQIPPNIRKRANSKLYSGRKLIRRGKYEKAIKMFDMAIQLDPFNLDIWDAAIDHLNKLGMSEDANKYQIEKQKYMPPK